MERLLSRSISDCRFLVLPIALKALEEGFKGIIIPEQNAKDVALLK